MTQEPLIVCIRTKCKEGMQLYDTLFRINRLSQRCGFFYFLKRLLRLLAELNHSLCEIARMCRKTKTVLKYWKRDNKFDSLSMLQWLHLLDTNKADPKPYIASLLDLLYLIKMEVVQFSVYWNILSSVIMPAGFFFLGDCDWPISAFREETLHLY